MLWLLRSPLALCGPLIRPGIYLVAALFSREASRNLHEGVKLHTAAVEGPTEPAHCVNTTGRFLVLRVGLGGGWGGTYFARGSLSVGICPVPAAKGCGVSVSAPPAGAASRGVPSPVGGGVIHPDREHDSSTHLRKDNRADRGCMSCVVAANLSQEVYCLPNLLSQNLEVATWSFFFSSPRETPTHVLRPTSNVSIPKKLSFIPSIVPTFLYKSIYPIVL